MRIGKRALDRRTFLRGAGAAMALPLLDSMIPALARASAAKPAIRLAFVYVPNGIIQKDWVPKATGSSFELMPTMQPLEEFRSRLLVLNNLAQLNGRDLGDGAGDHARAGATWLTGVHPKKTEGADIRAGISADQIAARALGRTTLYGSMELGIEEASLAGGCDSGYSCAYSNTISWRGPNTPNPMETNPRAVFERLFGEGDPVDAATRMKRMAEDRSILDFVTADVARLQSGLGPRDRNKLDEYLDAVRDIERRIQLTEQRSAAGDAPSMERPEGIPSTFAEHARLMSDLLVMAFRTDATRVITYMLAHEGSNRSYREIGVPDGHHSITHHQNDPDTMAKVQKIDRHFVESLAYLAGRLQATPDGDGTLLDHTLLLYGSSIRDGNQHDHQDLPLILLGGKSAGIAGGRHLVYKRQTPMNNLLLTMLDKVGVPAETLGDATGRLDQLSGI